MKARYAVLTAVFVLAVGASGAGEGDFRNCAVCKPMATEPGLMQNMKWETHPIATGMLAVTTVAADYEEAYSRAHKQMMANVEKLEAGKEMPLCPFCQRMSALAAGGARFENVETAGAHILAVTSDDSAMVEKIHDYQKWAVEQMAAMEAQHAQGG